jgi:alpha-2-macroglobulin
METIHHCQEKFTALHLSKTTKSEENVMRRAAPLLACVVILASLAGCRAHEALRAADPQQVQTFSGGLLSRFAPVQITFVQSRSDVAVGKELSPSPLAFNPPLKGVARWADERTLEFVPSSALPAGKRFIASVNLPGSGGFDFTFTVLAPHYDVSLGSLAVESEEGKSYHLDGTLTTMDREEPAAVEKMVRATLGGRALRVSWTHGSDPLEHAFRVSGIQRAAKAGVLDLAWSGSPIASRESGRRQLGVPSAKSFEVMAVRPVQADQRFIEVCFSESLKSPQDLQGLLRVQGRDDVHAAADGNVVRLYALSPWKQSETVTVEPGVQSYAAGNLVQLVAQKVTFKDELPQVRFVGSGAIVPTTQGVTVPIETVNLRAVIVKAFQIFGDNMTQFLQVNSLGDKREMFRVGKVVWRDVVQLGYTDDQKNVWVRHGLDLSKLIKDHPDGMFQLRVSFRPPHIVWPVSAAQPSQPVDYTKLPLVIDDPRVEQSSYWDYYDQEYNQNDYNSMNDPTTPAYYKPWYGEDRNVLAVRNVLVSNLGLIAKAEPSGDLHVFATDLRTAQTLPGVKITLQSFQRRVIASGLTDKQGMVRFSGTEAPDFIIGERAGQFAWLKTDRASALVTSHLDTGGEAVKGGVKGFLYGERGVWRPGDQIYLTFILSDPEKSLPANHPVTLEMRDPRGQLASRVTSSSSVDGFYSFATSTSADAPTGNWEARVKVGDRVFSRPVKVESIMPNRIKIGFDVPDQGGALSSGAFKGQINASWLYGAPASNLNAKISLRLTPMATVFPKYTDFIFDDPAREFSVADQTLFEGTLDDQGKADVSGSIDVQGEAPGKLSAAFQVRVFEQGGAFSSEQFSKELSPYDSYVGIRVPKGDATRGMLLVDTDHSVRIVMVDAAGNPVRSGSVQAEIYKLEWRWWWEKGDETLADFASSKSFRPIKSDRVSISNGAGEWKFRISYPDWGRYLIRVRDLRGGHSTGKVVYIDWPGWAGRSVEGKIGASMLTLATDKPSYKVGEQVSVTFPSNPEGRALVSLEEGGRIIKKEWMPPAKDLTRYTFITTPDMAPNIYVHVTFVQPHLQTVNDLPIRLYGIVPVMVEDPSTHLVPVIQSADTFRPGQKAVVSVKEAAGKEMTYTLAMVDEGLLRINRYSTPDPWVSFYQREASLLATWDLYDLVAGAFSGKLESMLAIGGGDEGFGQGERKANRFPPLVRFLGPVTLKKGATNTHSIDIPQYVGAVRIMVVAGHAGSYGAAESSVTVKSDLMVLPTLPRVLSLGETVQFPVSVFNTKEDLKSAVVTVSVTGPVSVAGNASQTVQFSGAEEQIARFTLNVGNKVGLATVSVNVVGGTARAAQETEIDVRVPASLETDVAAATIAQGKVWQDDETLSGYAGTNVMKLEVSRIPPMDLGKNLDYLVQYPHGCIEQTTSSVFPQLFLDKLVTLPPARAAQVQHNIEAGIRRLAWFQTSAGGFSFWPGYGEADEWGSTYAGHFLLEAKKRGFALPPDMLSRWTEYQQLKADAWTADSTAAGLQQAYRLYTLALAGAPDLGAMNRLRETRDLPPIAKWRLAVTYQLAGQKDEARRLVAGLGTSVQRYREMSGTYGSDLRDRAMILEAFVLMDMMDQADDLAVAVSQQLASSDPYATQTTAYALLALSQYAIDSAGDSPVAFTYTWAGSAPKSVSVTTPIAQEDVALGSALKGRLVITNASTTTLYARVIMQGVPTLGTEKAQANGLDLKVAYTDSNGSSVDPSKALPGSDITATLRVSNTSRSADYQQLALSFLLPGSWEVATARVASDDDRSVKNFDYQDIRDDRILTYFSLKRGEPKLFQFHLTAAYSGRFYMPSVSVEAMYDTTIHALVPGAWLGGK